MSNSNSSSGGVGFCGLLTVLLIGLKLTDNIDWSWWWVLSPIWLPLPAILLFAGFCYVIGKLLDVFR